MNYDTNLLRDIPAEIIAAARTVSDYMEANNIKDWKIGGCASREWLDRIGAENESWHRTTNALRSTNQALIAERDEADRRAGAAERRSASLQDDARARSNWLHKAKKEAGYDDEVSFDVVWANTLQESRERLEWASRAESAEAKLAELEGQEPSAWISHNGSIALHKEAFMPSIRHLAKPLYLRPIPAVPEGWQLVPKEATHEMCEAAHADPYFAENPMRASDREFWQEMYRTMLQAAPKGEAK